jgi:hypothetical protein
MDKLSKYNQKLLAIIGKTIVGGAALALIIGIGALIVTAIDFAGGGTDNGIQIRNNSIEKTDSTETIRTQAITINSPIQLDTAQAKFIIPVGQVNLETEEIIKNGNKRELKHSSYGYRYDSYSGLFNNFIFYDYDLGFKEQVFNEKIAITHWSYLKIDKDEILLFKGTKKDVNSDNQLDYSDYQSLFVYYISDRKLVEYDFEKSTVIEFEPMPKTNLISIKIGFDKDADFEYESRSEPQEIITLNVRTRKVTELVSTKMKNEIQSKID